MKVFYLFTFLVLSTVSFIACSKEEDEGHPTDTVEGLWIGTYGFGSESPDIFFSFNIKPGGVIEELNSNQLVKGSGTWELDDDDFTASYQWGAPYFTSFSVMATFDKSKGRLTGFWGYDDSAIDGGKWIMDKNN